MGASGKDNCLGYVPSDIRRRTVYHLRVVEHRGSSTLVRLRYVDSRTPFIPNPCRTLLEFRLNGESGALCDTVTLDVPAADVAQFLELNGGQTLFVRSPYHANTWYSTREPAYSSHLYVMISKGCMNYHGSLTTRTCRGPGHPIP
jgi:hypothetical protein